MLAKNFNKILYEDGDAEELSHDEVVNMRRIKIVKKNELLGQNYELY